MEEIIEHVYFEIKSSGYEKKLIGGIVITGGGAQLKHLVQLVEYVTGLECRIGFPNEHLAKNAELPKKAFDDLKSPLYATGIGLLIKGIETAEYHEEEHKGSKGTAKTATERGKSKFGFLEKLVKFINDDGIDVDDKEYTR